MTLHCFTFVQAWSLLLLLIQSANGQDGCKEVKGKAGSTMSNWVCSGESGQDSQGAKHTYFVPQTDDGPSKRALWSNNSWIPSEFRYQVSPYLKTATALRSCSGSAVTTYDTENSNLYGSRGQTVISQRDLDYSYCDTNLTEPIRLLSGLGRSVTIIEEDIFFPGGVIHITDGYFTKPTLLSSTLPLIEETCNVEDALLPGLAVLDYTPSITVFVPSDSALLSGIQCNETLPEEDALKVLDAHTLKGVVAYSPLLVDGAFFRAAGGEEINISVSNGTKYANGAKIIREDIVIKNGVVHVVDRAFFIPPVECKPKSTSSASTYSSIPQSSLLPAPPPPYSPEPTSIPLPTYPSETPSIPSTYSTEPNHPPPASPSETKLTPPTYSSEPQPTQSESKTTSTTPCSTPTIESIPIQPPPTHTSKPTTPPPPISTPCSSTFETSSQEFIEPISTTTPTPHTISSEPVLSSPCLTSTSSSIISTSSSSPTTAETTPCETDTTPGSAITEKFPHSRWEQAPSYTQHNDANRAYETPRPGRAWKTKPWRG